MSPEEALEAEATEISPLKLKESGVDALGYPYQYYEGKWNVGIHPAGLQRKDTRCLAYRICRSVS